MLKTIYIGIGLLFGILLTTAMSAIVSWIYAREKRHKRGSRGAKSELETKLEENARQGLKERGKRNGH